MNIRSALRSSRRAYDRFLFASCAPETCVVLRILFALLMLVYTVVWMRDGSFWFSDEGVLSVRSAQALLHECQWSLFFWVAGSPELVQFGLWMLLIHSVCLLLGCYSRVQAACIFFWLVSFQHRNPVICDGEDAVFRLFAFFFIFLPLDHTLSLSNRRPALAPQAGRARAWGLRLIQIEMSLIYLSAAWCKYLGAPWRDGSALYYVYQMPDLFGRGPLPAWLLESEPLTRLATWSVIAIEALLPLGLWWRRTRTLAVFVGFGLHLTIEYSMHLFLFQWIMMVGLLSFVDFSYLPGMWKRLTRGFAMRWRRSPSPAESA